jgi:transposase-like protein
MKICCICEQEKEYTLFYKNKYSKDGFDYKCKECQKDYSSKNKKGFKNIIKNTMTITNYLK